MRTRIPPHLENSIRSLALRRGISDQAMLDLIISSGLAVTGQPPAVLSPPLGDLSDEEMTEVKVPLDPQLRANLRELAAKHGHSQRKMAARVLTAGLKQLGDAN